MTGNLPKEGGWPGAEGKILVGLVRYVGGRLIQASNMLTTSTRVSLLVHVVDQISFATDDVWFQFLSRLRISNLHLDTCLTILLVLLMEPAAEMEEGSVKSCLYCLNANPARSLGCMCRSQKRAEITKFSIYQRDKMWCCCHRVSSKYAPWMVRVLFWG